MTTFSVPRRSPSRRPWARLLLAGAVVSGGLFAAAACGDDDDGAPDDVTVGALLDLSGSWSNLGKPSEAALALAADFINSQPESEGYPTITIEVTDTGLDPDKALSELQRLADDEDIRVFVGPQSSSEVTAVREYADENGLTVISQGSTASSLAIAGDTVFRLPPVDVRETEALAALLAEDGIETIIPIWRADVGNEGLQAALRTGFTAAGGAVTEGVEYPAIDPDFDAVLDEVEAQLAGADGEVAIYLAAFGEVVDLFKAAADRPELGEVTWYGSDGAARLDALIADPDAAAFAVQVQYPNPIFGLDQTPAGIEKWGAIAAQIRERSGIEPDAFALSAYDAVILIANAVREAGTLDAEELGAALAGQAAAMDGITGPLTLNAAGDRDNGAHDFWAVCEGDAGFTWVLVASYVPGADGGTITRLEGCE